MEKQTLEIWSIVPMFHLDTPKKCQRFSDVSTGIEMEDLAKMC